MKIHGGMRRGAAYTLFGAFHMMHAVASVLDNISREMYNGLTPNERDLVAKKSHHFRDEGEVLRVLAWRLLGKEVPRLGRSRE